ncbi:MAG TPA: alpha/beta hydrolase [Thermoleophilaceae bacterium]|jgi:pimeloyl-ACP methyl ester carboxylesterase
MAKLELTDGTELHWHEHGAGPGALVCGIGYGSPEAFQGLIDDLSKDHRVVVPDLRGTGESSRHGPYDIETDVSDLAAVLERGGAVGVAIGLGDGCHRAIELGAARPDLLGSVIMSGYAPLSRGELRAGLSGSGQVLEALVKLLETDYRAGLRTIIETGNPGLDEGAIRERLDKAVAHCSHEAATARLRSWIRLDVRDAARALGDRLWVLHHERNPWFPEELADGVSDLLPEARIEKVDDGALSRPDLTAAVVRRITGAAG